MIAHAAILDVSADLAGHLAWLLQLERRRRGTRAGTRALSCFWQAVLGLRWFRDRIHPERPGRDHELSRATAYRYVDEVITVLAEQAPDLHEALQQAHEQDMTHVILDGTVITTDRLDEKPPVCRAQPSTCGTPARQRPTAARSRRCRCRTDSHCGSPTWIPAQPMT